MRRATDSKKDINSKLKFRSTRLRVRDVAFLMVPHIQLNDIILIDSNTAKKLTRHMTYFSGRESTFANLHCLPSERPKINTRWHQGFQTLLYFVRPRSSKDMWRMCVFCRRCFPPGENLLFFRLRESSGREVGGLSKSIVTAATKRCLTCLSSSQTTSMIPS